MAGRQSVENTPFLGAQKGSITIKWSRVDAASECTVVTTRDERERDGKITYGTPYLKMTVNLPAAEGFARSFEGSDPSVLDFSEAMAGAVLESLNNFGNDPSMLEEIRARIDAAVAQEEADVAALKAAVQKYKKALPAGSPGIYELSKAFANRLGIPFDPEALKIEVPESEREEEAA